MTQAAPDLFPQTTPTRDPDIARAAAIVVSDVVHKYPPVTSRRGKKPTQGSSRELALDHISLAIPRGGIFGLLGPNGGGKSTLFRIIATILRPTTGSVSVMGHDVQSHSHLVRSHLGVLFQSPSLDIQLTAWENLRHQGHLYGLSGSDLKNRIHLWLDRLGLMDNRDDRVLTFSGGMRRRLELAKALLHNPSVLLLDEPATGLDPAARRDVWEHLVRLRDENGVTVALTTHLMDEADRCDELAIMNDGKLLAVNTPAAFKASIGGDIISITPAQSDDPQTLQPLRQLVENSLPAGLQVTPEVVEGKIFLECPDGPAMVAHLGSALSGKIRSISVGQPTLEDVFMQLTGKTMKRATL